MEKHIIDNASKIFDTTAYDRLWINPRGEFFSNENFCANSLKENEQSETISRKDIERIRKASKEKSENAIDSDTERKEVKKRKSKKTSKTK